MAKKDPEDVQYSKEQYIGSDRYAAVRDVLTALLADGETYTSAQVDQLLEEFKKQEAK